MDTPSRRLNDFYHDFGDDQDEKDDEYIDFDNIELYLNKEDEIKQVVNKDNQQQQQQIEEQHLSQKLNQLLTSTEQQQQPSADQIPTYLLSNNQTFEEIMNSLLQKSTNTIIQIKDLQQIAFLKHKLALIEIDISLWTTYLHSGTSQLRFENEQQQPEQEPQQQLLELLTVQPYLSIWPEALTKTMLQTGKFIKDELTYYVYLNYVEYTLQGLRNQQLDYHVQINQKKQQLNHYFTLEMEQAIDQFIQQQNDIILYRLQIESKILIVKYDYKDRLIELEFGRELPYQYQRNVFDNLTQTKLNKEIAKMEVALLKQRLANNYLPETLDSFQISPPESLNTITNQTMRQRIIDRQAKVVERTKSDMMMVYIMAAEAQFNENKMKFDTDTAQMKHYQRYGEADQKFTEKMLQIMQRSFFRQSSDGSQKSKLNRRSSSSSSSSSSLSSSFCSPTIINDTIHQQLSFEQLKYLHRGPTYVTPCQIHLSSTSVQLHQILTKQILPLQRQLTQLFTKYSVDLSCRMNFEKDLQKQFIKSFSQPIPLPVQQRVLYEKQLIESIQYQFKSNRLILRRTADNNNTYYLGQLDQFNSLAHEYMTNALCYEIIGRIDENNTEQQEVNRNIRSINLALEQLEQKKLINKNHLSKCKIDDNKKININLPHLYFLPATHQDGHVSLQPRFSIGNNYPIQKLATFLDQLLRSLFDKYSQSTTLLNGHDFIQKLQAHCLQADNLLPSTNFITYKIHNLHIRVAHADLLTALNRFLVQATDRCRHENLSTDTIEELTRIFLENNIFINNRTIYKYIKGSPFNLSFSRLLFNIYLQYWQAPIITEIRLTDQFYGRYHDMGFLTWYGSTERLQLCLSELNEKHPDIQITTSIGTQVHFLNVYIENRKGCLFTRVYHDLTKQPFLLPYVTGHARLIHRQWFRFTLIRAGIYCTHWDDFNEERLYIELTYLANGYSLDCVQYYLEQFFSMFNPIEKGIALNRWTYPSFRTKLFRYLNEEKYNFEQQQLAIKNQKLIQLYYLFDWGCRSEFNQQFYKLWSQYLDKDPLFKKHNLKIKLNSKHCYSSNTLLTTTTTQ